MSDSGQTGVHQGRSVNDLMAEYTDRLQKENAELRARVDSLTFIIEDTFANQLRQEATEQEKTDE